MFLGLAALVVDQGLAADTQGQAQTAADAYALADFGVSAAEWSARTTTTPGFSPLNGTPCSSQNSAGAVRVVLPSSQITSIFGRIYGVSSRTVTSGATAGSRGSGTGCVMCITSAARAPRPAAAFCR